MSADENQLATQAHPPSSASQVPEGALDRAPSGAPRPPGDSVLDVIERAARDPSVDLDKFERLMAMRERLETRQAQAAFNAALSAAKGEIEPIVKKREVDYENERGSRTRYAYEEFADVTRVVDPIFQKHGLSYRFKTAQSGARLKVTPVISHAGGYSEEMTPLESDLDASGKKNPIQSLGSALTYLQRYSLRAALGLAAARDDDSAASDEPPFVMGPDEIVYVETLIRDTESNLEAFLKAIGAPSIPELNGEQYKKAISLLNEKKRRASRGAKKP